MYWIAQRLVVQQLKMVHHLKLVHQFLFTFVAPIDITYALLTIMKVGNMSCPICTQHAFHTRAHIANSDAFLNPLDTLLSLINNLIRRRLVMVMIARVTWSTLHLGTIFNIIS